MVQRHAALTNVCHVAADNRICPYGRMVNVPAAEYGNPTAATTLWFLTQLGHSLSSRPEAESDKKISISLRFHDFQLV